MRTWIRDPIAVLAEGAARGLVVEGGQIVELVGAAGPASPCEGVFEASRYVIVPGLVNTHHHFYQTLTRAHPAAMNKALFPWLKALYPVWGAHLDRDNFRLAVRLALAELLLSGCTTACDHLFVFGLDMADAVDIEADEASALGMRIMLTRGAINLGARSGGIADERLMQGYDTVIADCERVLTKYHDRSPGAFRSVALAPCAPFNVTRQLMLDTAELAKKHNCRLHTHLGETRDENDYCLHHFGCRPLDYLEQVGWLSDRVWLAHGIHFQDDEVERLGRHQVGICHCPTSNMLLSSGACRTKELESAGAIVGLGVDGSASNDSGSMTGEARQAMLLQRVGLGPSAMTARQALELATIGGARVLGRDDIGSLAPGMAADIAAFDLRGIASAGALHDPVASLVFCAPAVAAWVVVNGRVVVREGRLETVDLRSVVERHNRLSARLVSG